VAHGLQDVVNDPEAGVAAIAARNPRSTATGTAPPRACPARQHHDRLGARERPRAASIRARFLRSARPDRETYEFQNEPDASLYFTDAFLPDDGSLMIE
jgi:NitT/TauT family transport system substrate-binding protein